MALSLAWLPVVCEKHPQTTIKTIVPQFKKAALPMILTTIIFRRRMATFSTMIGSKVNKSCN